LRMTASGRHELPEAVPFSDCGSLREGFKQLGSDPVVSA
jgi:hypothetical protein